MARLQESEPIERIRAISEELPSPLNRFGLKPNSVESAQKQKSDSRRKQKPKSPKKRNKQRGRDPNRGLTIDCLG